MENPVGGTPETVVQGTFFAFRQWHEMKKDKGNNLFKAVRSTPFMLLAKGGKCPPPRREAVLPIQAAESGSVRRFFPRYRQEGTACQKNRSHPA